MLYTWMLSIAAFFILPFQLISRSLSYYGVLVLAVFIAAFCIGTFLRTPTKNSFRIRRPVRPDFQRADKMMAIVASIAMLVLLYEAADGNFLNLQDSFQTRSDRAQALMLGGASDSSLAFQIGFLIYPIGFVVIVRELTFRLTPDIFRLVTFGLGPILLASLVMGGRGPLLFGLFLLVLGIRAKRLAFTEAELSTVVHRTSTRRKLINLFLVIIGLISMNYFIDVFIVRANAAGGIDQMLDVAASVWGVDFRGPGSSILRSVSGDGITYLIFVFIWYLVQGFVMSNVLFTDFDSAPSLGIYGIDLAAAVVRRIDGEFVGDRFYALLDLNTYGFLPSAFGSLYVDFLWFGLLPTIVWGYLAAFVYQKTREVDDARWVLLGPLVTMGIIFSLINTPLGFGNGLITHFWFVTAFLLLKKPQPARSMASTAAGSGTPNKQHVRTMPDDK